MLETIFEWFVSVLANILEWIVDIFMNSLNFSLETLVSDFPIFVTAYDIFLAVGIGLTVCIASWSFYQYFFGSVSEIQETPVNILIRAFIAVILIYVGGHVLEWIVYLARLPYEAMLDINAVQPFNDSPLGALTSQEQMTSYLTSVHPDSVAVGIGLTLAPGAVLLVYLIMLLLVAWNVLHLMVEVCQRFVWIGILVYSSPLAFSTAASKTTSNVLKKWFSMFLSQCLLMTFSIWTLKLAVSGFTYNPLNEQSYLVRFLMTIAMCKVAQNLDREIQKLGLNAATTGGNLIDSVEDAVAAMGITGRARGGKTYGGEVGDVPFGGAGGGGIFGASVAAQGVKAGLNAYASGATKEEAVAAGQKTVASAAETTKTRTENSVKAARYAATTAEAKAGTEAWKQRQATYSKGPSSMSDFQASARAAGASAQDAAKEYPLMNGSGSAYTDDNGRVQLDEQATEAGLKISPARMAKNGAQLQESIEGKDAVVADHIASNYNSSGNAGARYQEMLKDTANQRKGMVSEAALMDPTHELRPDTPYDTPGGNTNGACSNDTVGSALMENAFGKKATPDRNAETGYTGVSAATLSDSVDDYGNTRHGGRVVDANYTDKKGNAMHVRISDEVGYHNMTPDQQAKQRTFAGASGETYYAQTWAQGDFEKGVKEGNIPVGRTQTASSGNAGGSRASGGAAPIGGSGGNPVSRNAAPSGGNAGAGGNLNTTTGGNANAGGGANTNASRGDAGRNGNGNTGSGNAAGGNVQSVVYGQPPSGAATVGNITNQTTNNYTQSSGSDSKNGRSGRSSDDNRDRGRRRDDPNGANITNTSGRPLKKD